MSAREVAAAFRDDHPVALYDGSGRKLDLREAIAKLLWKEVTNVGLEGRPVPADRQDDQFGTPCPPPPWPSRTTNSSVHCARRRASTSTILLANLASMPVTTRLGEVEIPLDDLLQRPVPTAIARIQGHGAAAARDVQGPAWLAEVH